MPRRSLRGWRTTSALLLAVAVLVACGDTDSDAEDSSVRLTVPEDWTRSDPEVTADVLESLRWTPPSDDGSSLQVVVGCGDDTTAEELLQGAAAGERPMPVVGTADEPRSVEVEGLEEARRVTFALGVSADDVRLWMGGLYGVGDGVLVLVEMVRPHARFSRSTVDEVLGSVEVDTSDVAERCTATAGD